MKTSMGDEIIVRVRVRADMRRERITEVKPHDFTIDVREPAERNEANERVLALLTMHYNVPIKNAHIISGHQSGNKKVAIYI
jgi:uncharacterized protein YggU (UPF0235/DUF167 family)